MLLLDRSSHFHGPNFAGQCKSSNRANVSTSSGNSFSDFGFPYSESLGTPRLPTALINFDKVQGDGGFPGSFDPRLVRRSPLKLLMARFNDGGAFGAGVYTSYVRFQPSPLPAFKVNVSLEEYLIRENFGIYIPVGGQGGNLPLPVERRESQTACATLPPGFLPTCSMYRHSDYKPFSLARLRLFTRSVNVPTLSEAAKLARLPITMNKNLRKNCSPPAQPPPPHPAFPFIHPHPFLVTLLLSLVLLNFTIIQRFQRRRTGILRKSAEIKPE